MKEKIELRKQLLKQRNEMKKQDVKELSNKITRNLINMPLVTESKVIMVYLSFKNEVDTEMIIDWCFKEGKEVVVPYSDTNSKEIIPCRLNRDKKELEKNNLGIFEPKKELMEAVDIEKIDLIIVPGVGFDKNCNRIGFGGGYYDKFLVKKQKNTLAIAICYENQIVEHIPKDVYDIPMDMIVTEKNIFYKK